MTSRITRSRKPQPVLQHENQVRAKWTPSLTKTLVDLMVDQIQKGNKSNKTFSKKGWKFICDNFHIQTGYWWDNEQLKSRYIALRKQYISVRLLLNHCDFQWDETSGKITATDEAWVRYIKVVAFTSSIFIPLYKILCAAMRNHGGESLLIVANP